MFPTTKTWVRRKVTLVCSRCGLRWWTPWTRLLLLMVFVGGVFFICSALAVGTLIALDGPFSWSQQVGWKWATLVAFLVGWLVPGAVHLCHTQGMARPYQ